MEEIILASHSPRRKELLEKVGIPFIVVTKTTDESFPVLLPKNEVAIHIARNKALAVKEKIAADFHGELNHKSILAADTIVVVDDDILGKPANRSEAIQMILSLSDRKHQVITGVVLLIGSKEIAFAEVTNVYFNAFTPEEAAYYVDNYAPFDKAGGYAIQEWIGLIGIKAIEGDFYNVMGLPINKIYSLLCK
ncbi:MAG: septum formation protein Maf [Sphingobacteriales bacterium]|uniref:Maf family nucleotide pyrophosphatase n=1 Tax=Hydrotalea flava TaxID=714549 RepID=UPI00082EB1EF|nr:Maf family nucleotide pyrophosphatase [Hydrotalea flava]RTL56786.1 MAG: septum formation protein Maf [Sphingobacteriales bacterium]